MWINGDILVGWFLILIPMVLTAPPASSTSEPLPTPSTIIDILSSQAQFSTFLLILQRKDMISTINSLQNVTILAPVNSAFVDTSLKDISHEELKRYIIDQRFRVGWMDSKSAVFNTLYKLNGKPYQVSISPNFKELTFEVDHSATIVEADIYAKHQWSFIQAIDKQTPVKQSMCDILMDYSTSQLNGYNVTFIKSLFHSLFYTEQEDLVKKKKHKPVPLPVSCEQYLNTTQTIFIPTDEMIFQSISNITQRYYTSLNHTLNGNRFTSTDESVLEIKHDIVNLLNNLILPDQITSENSTKSRYSSSTKLKYKVRTINDSLVLNDKIISSEKGSNIVVKDGIFHVFHNLPETNFFQDLDIPIVEMIPRKALYALHYSRFVDELEFRSLTHLIDGTNSDETILLSVDQRDDVEDDEGYVSKRTGYLEDLEERYFPRGFNNKQSLMYQFINTRINLTAVLEDDDTYYELGTTHLCSKKKIDGCFKIKISSSKSSTNSSSIISRINDDIKVKSDAFDIGNNSIAYIVDKDIEPPSNLKHSLADLLSNGDIQRHVQHIKINQQECLKTIQYLNDFGLLNLKENSLGYSAFLPCGIPVLSDDDHDGNAMKFRGSWESLGLILNHLEKNPKLFKQILKGIFVQGSIYSDFGLHDDDIQSIEARTMTGDLLTISNEYFDGDYNHLLKLNSTLVPLPLNSDIIFNQGVIHIISGLLLPTHFEVSFLDLIKATEDDTNSTFLKLLEQFPKLLEALKLGGLEKSDFSMLVPTPESLSLYNVTVSMGNLLEFLELHIIPNAEIQKLFDCMSDTKVNELANTGYLINSNHSDISFMCRRNSHGKTVLEINDENGDRTDHKLKIISHGCTTATRHNSSCVFLIDKPINLKWIKESDGFLNIHLGFVSVGIGVILGLVLFSFMIFLIMYCLSADKSQKVPSNPFINDDTPSFMGIGTIQESGAFDRGYETDDDHERNSLTLDKSRPKNYGTITQSSRPMSIKGRGNKLNRNRNLPGY